MKQALLCSLIMTIAGLGGCTEQATPTSVNAESEIQIEAESSGQAEGAAKKAEESPVHGGNPTAAPAAPPQASAKGLPPGHPPLQNRMPPGHPPMGGAAAGSRGKPRGPFMGGPVGPNDGAELPLEIGDHSPSADMTAGRTAIQEEDLQKKFEEAFRKTFTQDRKLRDYDGAEKLLQGVLEKYPKHPQALRTMGYVAVNQGFNVKKATEYYKKSVEADDNYGPGHYALAFMYARGDRSIGAEHYKKAIALGIPDARQIGKSFYPHLAPAAPPAPSRKGLPPGHP